MEHLNKNKNPPFWRRVPAQNMNLVIKEQVLGFRQPISLEGYPKCTVLKCGPPPYLPAGLEQKVVRRIFRRSACRQHVPGVRIPPL